MEVTKQRLILGIAGGGVGVILLLYLLVYGPLLAQIKRQGPECRALEGEAAQAWANLALLKKGGRAKRFLTEGEVALAIDQLTRQGKSVGINFISLTPGAMEKPEDSKYRILPIEIEMESSYEALGRFLGSLGEMESGLVTVRGFETTPEAEEPSNLRTRLTVQTYLVA